MTSFRFGRIAVAAAVATTMLLATGCAQSARGRIAAPIFTGEIVIGADLELTGPASVIGIAHRNALQVVVDQLNELGVKVGGETRKVRLVVRDNATDPAKAATVAQELVDTDRVAAIVGAGTTGASMAMVKVAESRNVPMVSMAAGDDIVRPVPQRQYCFKVTPNGNDVAATVVSHMVRMNVKRLGVLTAAGVYGDIVTQVMTGAVKVHDSDGIALTKVERFADDGSDLAVKLPQLLSARPEAIMIGSLLPGAAYAIGALRAAGYTGRVFLDPSSGADQLLTGATRQNAEGMYMVHPAVLDGNPVAVTTPAGLTQREFYNRYTQAHGAFSGVAPYAADALRLAVRAVSQAGTTDHAKVREALEQTQYDGIAGGYEFSVQNHGGMEPDALALFIVQGGGWARVS